MQFFTTPAPEREIARVCQEVAKPPPRWHENRELRSQEVLPASKPVRALSHRRDLTCLRQVRSKRLTRCIARMPGLLAQVGVRSAVLDLAVLRFSRGSLGVKD